MTYEERLEAVSDKAWIEWTSGALFWNAEDEETYELAMQAKRHVQETTARAYADGLTDEEWLSATLKLLESD